MVGEQYSSGSSPFAELALAFDPVLLRHLGGVLAGEHSGVPGGEFAVQVAEERVDPGGLLALERLAQRVRRTVHAVAGAPAQRAGVEAVVRARPGSRVRVSSPARASTASRPAMTWSASVGRDRARQPGRVAAQVAAERAAAGDGQRGAAPARACRAGEHDTDIDEPLVLAHRPRLDQVGAGQLLGPVEAVLGEDVDVDGTDAAELIEQDPGQLEPLLRPDLVEQVGARPRVGVGGELGEVAVGDGEQPDLLQVGHGDPPAALQVDVELVLDHAAQGTFGVGFRAELGVRGGGEVLHLQPQRAGDRGGDVFVGQAGVAGGGERPVQRAAQLGHLDEVVEVPRLQAGVLPVVDEGQQLAGLRIQLARVDAAQAAHDRRGQQADRAGAALGVEGGELAEVVAADLFVGDAAAHAERERSRHEPRLQALTGVVEAAVRAQEDSVRQVLALAVEHLDLVGVRVGDQPRVGQRVRRPAGRRARAGRG